MYSQDIDKLLQEYEPIIDKVANLNPVKSSYFSKEDLKQEFRMILVKCNDTFDKSKKTSFKSYFITSCKYFVWGEWASNRHPMNERLDKEMSASFNGGASYIDILSDDSLPQDDIYYDFMSVLDNIKDGWMVRDIILNNRTYGDIAQQLGLSRERIRQRYENALDSLRPLVNIAKRNV